MPGRTWKALALGFALVASGCTSPSSRAAEPHAPPAPTSTGAGTLADIELRTSGSGMEIQLHLAWMGRTFTTRVALRWSDRKTISMDHLTAPWDRETV